MGLLDLEVIVSAAIPLRPDFDGSTLRALAKAGKDADQTRRLLALAQIYDGGSRTDAARLGGVGLQIVRDWVIKFNSDGPDALITGRAPGRKPRLNDEHRQGLFQIVRDGPTLEKHGVVRWRLKDLCQWLYCEYGISLKEDAVSRELKKLGFVKLTARPRHAQQDEQALEDFKKTSPQR